MAENNFLSESTTDSETPLIAKMFEEAVIDAISVTNARAGFEGERNISHTDSPEKVIVIRAGPAGLEVAYHAAEAGHIVDLYEKSNEINGQI